MHPLRYIHIFIQSASQRKDDTKHFHNKEQTHTRHDHHHRIVDPSEKRRRASLQPEREAVREKRSEQKYFGETTERLKIGENSQMHS